MVLVITNFHRKCYSRMLMKLATSESFRKRLSHVTYKSTTHRPIGNICILSKLTKKYNKELGNLIFIEQFTWDTSNRRKMNISFVHQ